MKSELEPSFVPLLVEPLARSPLAFFSLAPSKTGVVILLPAVFLLIIFIGFNRPAVPPLTSELLPLCPLNLLSWSTEFFRWTLGYLLCFQSSNRYNHRSLAYPCCNGRPSCLWFHFFSESDFGCQLSLSHAASS
jgi:hypothetical protein